MKEIIKNGVKLFGKIIVINILSFILVMSIAAIAVGMLKDKANPDTYGVILQILTLTLLAGLVYPTFWDMGYKDRNMALTGNAQEDILKGFKIGLVSIIPSILSIPLFALIKAFPSALYKLINSSYYYFFDILTRGTDKFCDISIWKFFVMAIIFLLVPAVSFLGYYLGFKDFSINSPTIVLGIKLYTNPMM